MIGIDISKETLDCSMADPLTRKLVWHMTVPNDADGIKTIRRRTPKGMAWVIEPTGRYGQKLVEAAMRHNQTLLMAPPRQARLFSRSVHSRAKTDRLDSYALALYALAQPLKPYPVKSEELEHVDQLLNARKGLVQALTALKQRQRDLPYARKRLEKAVKHLEEQIRAIDEQIASETSSSEEMAVASELEKVPGIGPVTAAAVTVTLVSKQFERPEQFVAHVGLDVAVVASGKRRGELGLSRQGDSELRRLLYCCAQSSTRCRKDQAFRERYERELAKGLSKTAALCAVARKMARVCWGIWRHGSRYKPEWVNKRLSKPGGSRRSGMPPG